MDSTLRDDLVHFYDHSLGLFSSTACLPSSEQIDLFEDLARRVAQQRALGILEASTAMVAKAVASNLSTFCAALTENEKVGKVCLDVFENDVGLLFQDLHVTDNTRSRRRTRQSSPTPSSSAYLTPPPDSPPPKSPSPSHLPSPAPSTPPLIELQPADHLRLWFLDNLANPYPTITEKKHLSSITGIARNKIDSDMTNWRRRAGWTDIKDTYAQRDKTKMRELIERVELGEEKRKSVCEAVEKMKAYLERREEYGVGSWVFSLKKMAKEQAKKRPRIEGKAPASSRPMTPPPSANVTPASSIAGSSSTPFGINNATSPAISLRSASSTSSLSSNTSLPTFTSFKPYSFTPSTTMPFSSTSMPAPSTTVLAPGVKRTNTEPTMDVPYTRQKLAPSPFSSDAIPRWTSPDFSMPQTQPQPYVSSTSIYPSQTFGEVDWSTTAPMPAHLPHMSATSATPRTMPMPMYTLPQTHDFAFSAPMSNMRGP